MRSFAGTIVPKKYVSRSNMYTGHARTNTHNIILLSFTRHATFVKIKMHNLKGKKV